jgi:hypothetical protein
MTQDWDSIPTYDINIGSLKLPTDILSIMKARGIIRYLYRINYRRTVIKFGMSCPKSGAPGERLYRQIGHAKGWIGQGRLGGQNGADWRVIEETFAETYGGEIIKDDITVKIWDLTNYVFASSNIREEVNRMEAELIEQFINIAGILPIGNLRDEQSVKAKSRVLTSTYQDIFEEA